MRNPMQTTNLRPIVRRAAAVLGLRPEGGILTGGQTAQTLTVKAVNGCATDITVASLNLSIAGFK